MSPPAETSAREGKSKRPDNSAFKQQTLKAWRPILTPRLVVILFSSVGIIFLPIGIAIIVASNEIVEAESAEYGSNNQFNSTPTGGAGCCYANCDGYPWERKELNPCEITISIKEKMSKPVYMYYKLTNYYQNHRRYVRSRDDQQLVGKTLSSSDVSDTCTYHYQWGSNNDVINPCGLIAWSMFNDTYQLSLNGASIPLTQDSIAWQSDLDTKFKNNNDGQTGQNFPPFAYWRNISCDDGDPTPGTGLPTPTTAQRQSCTDANTANPGVGWCFKGSGYCTEDQHFVVWMRSAGLPNFRKLYAKIDQDLPAGDYTLTISNGVRVGGSGSPYLNYGVMQTGSAEPAPQQFLYPVGSFSGTKTVVVSTVSWIGGRNFFLGYAYLVVGIVCIVLAICFFVKSRLSPRDLGSAPYVSWNKDATPK